MTNILIDDWKSIFGDPTKFGLGIPIRLDLPPTTLCAIQRGQDARAHATRGVQVFVRC